MRNKLIVTALLTAVSGATFIAPVAQAEPRSLDKRFCDYPLVNNVHLPENDSCDRGHGGQYTSQ